MKSVVIDANVFHAFFFETIHGTPFPDRTASAMPIFEILGKEAVSFLDEESQIESEWRDLSKGAEEWFNNWLAEAYASGKLFEIDHARDPQLVTRYRKVGFPGGRDIWYVRVAHALACMCRRSRPCLIAEDIDFYDPAKKDAGNKMVIFKSGKGPVAAQLKNDGIDVCCIETFCIHHCA